MGYSQRFSGFFKDTILILCAKHAAGTQRHKQQEVQDGYLFSCIKILNDFVMSFVLHAALNVQPSRCQC